MCARGWCLVTPAGVSLLFFFWFLFSLAFHLYFSRSICQQEENALSLSLFLSLFPYFKFKYSRSIWHTQRRHFTSRFWNEIFPLFFVCFFALFGTHEKSIEKRNNNRERHELFGLKKKEFFLAKMLHDILSVQYTHTHNTHSSNTHTNRYRHTE